MTTQDEAINRAILSANDIEIEERDSAISILTRRVEELEEEVSSLEEKNSNLLTAIETIRAISLEATDENPFFNPEDFEG